MVHHRGDEEEETWLQMEVNERKGNGQTEKVFGVTPKMGSNL